MIRVVFGVNDFLVGGMQRQFIEQLKRYDRTRFDIVLVTLFSFPGERDLYNELPADLAVHRLAFKSVLDIGSWVKLVRLMGKLKPQVVVSSLFFSNMAFRALAPFFKYQVIAREHNTYLGKPAWQRFVDRLLALVSYRIVAVSSSVASFTAAQECINPSKFEVIHNGIDTQAATRRLATLSSVAQLKKDMGVHAGERIFLNVSRLMPQKNHHLLIEGFAQFQATHPKFRLFIVGDGPLRIELEGHALRLGVGSEVTFFGHRDDVWSFYKIAESYVSASDMEGLSNSMLEALASGLPIVSTKTAGTDELVIDGQNGFFAEPTPEGIANALARVALAVHEGMGDRARESVRRFDLSHTVAAYQHLFEAAHAA